MTFLFLFSSLNFNGASMDFPLILDFVLMKIWLSSLYFVNVMHVAVKNNKLWSKSYFKAKSLIFDLIMEMQTYSIFEMLSSFLLNIRAEDCIKTHYNSSFY